jgi:hypothetical protein
MPAAGAGVGTSPLGALIYERLIRLTRPLVLARPIKLDKHLHIQVLEKPGRPGMCWRFLLLPTSSRRVARLLGPVDSCCPARAP